MNYQLYKLSKTGKILSFKIEVFDGLEGDHWPYIRTEKGFIDGAKQVDEKEFEQGKNLGRANETTGYEQALAEAKSQYKKLLDKGYKDPGDTLDLYTDDPPYWLRKLEAFLKAGAGTDASGKLKPMLAHKTIDPIEFPCYGNYKYDGVRCFSFMEDGGIEKVSRNGKPFVHLNHINADLSEFFGHMNCIVDGELYSHSMTFQGIISSVKREQKSNLEIGYRIYDVIPLDNLKMSQIDRWQILHDVKKLLYSAKARGEKHHIMIAPYYRIEDMDDVKELFTRAISKGYEGAIFRNQNAPYHFGHRSRNLMKYKEFIEDEEFEIIGAEEATGRDAGTAVFILLTNTEPRQEFRARPMGTFDERRDYLININKYIGKKGTVKFQNYTDDGLPRFPVFKAVRDYEG